MRFGCIWILVLSGYSPLFCTLFLVGGFFMIIFVHGHTSHWGSHVTLLYSCIWLFCVIYCDCDLLHNFSEFKPIKFYQYLKSNAEVGTDMYVQVLHLKLDQSCRPESWIKSGRCSLRASSKPEGALASARCVQPAGEVAASKEGLCSAVLQL